MLAAGGDSAKCTFAGVGKSREEIEYALEQGVYSFNVESEAELDYIDRIAGAKKTRAPIALRANPDVESHTHEYISTGSHENKFGIGLDRIAAVYERAAKMTNLEIVGVQMHIGSQITEAPPFANAISKLAPVVRKLKTKYGIKFLSIGGGMGIIYRRALESGSGKWWHDHGGESSAFSIRDYADAIMPPLRELNVRILVEPGRFLVGNAGVLLTRVRYVKKSGAKKFAIVDAGMNDLIRPALYQSYHEIVPVRQSITSTSMSKSKSKSKSKTEKIDIVGPVCESGDFFALDGAGNATTSRGRFAGDHERGRLRICDGVQLQFASAAGRGAGARRQIRADSKTAEMGRPGAERSRGGMVGIPPCGRPSAKVTAPGGRARPLAQFRAQHK